MLPLLKRTTSEYSSAPLLFVLRDRHDEAIHTLTSAKAMTVMKPTRIVCRSTVSVVRSQWTLNGHSMDTTMDTTMDTVNLHTERVHALKRFIILETLFNA